MELRQLESFLVLSATLHFGRAAERVCLSQSALSRQIQSLERELGVVLFERTGRRVALTPQGHTLAAYAQRVIDEIQEARRAISEQAESCKGSLSISCFDGASVYLMPAILAAVHASYPLLSISVATLKTGDALRALREGSVDAAMVTLPVPLSGFVLSPLFREQLVLTMPAQHPLASHRKVPVKLLRNERLVTARRGQNTWRLVDEALESEGGAPTAVFELESAQARKDAVRAGLGVAILGGMSVVRPALGTGLITRPLAPPLYRDVGLITRSGRSQSPLVRLFTQMAIATALQLGALPAVTN